MFDVLFTVKSRLTGFTCRKVHLQILREFTRFLEPVVAGIWTGFILGILCFIIFQEINFLSFL